MLHTISTSEWAGLFGNTKVNPIQRRVLDKAFYASKRIIKFKAREFTET
jgi:hypothetical protein